MDRMDEVKKIIRSLLVSAPLKVTVSSLNRDYRDLDGTYIPYKELGYNSLLHFLHSLPDILKVNGSSNESEVTLVVSEKIAHVNDLVMKQKKPSKGKNRCVKRKSVIPSETIRIPINNNYNSASTQVVSQNLVSTAPVLSPFPRPLLTYNKNVPSLPKCSNSVLKNDQTEVSQNLSRRNDIPEIKLNLEKLKLHKLNQNKTHKECDSNHVSEFYEYNQEKKIVKGRVNEENKVLNVLNNITVTFRNDLIDEEVGIVNIAKGKSEKIPLEIQNNLKILISKYPFGILYA
ncbi:hypothetical protein HHI36_005870 [Cryptolaemus montrouzieri]|uniref:HTH OST-type domain-containing protein n=1 Tax=Cryptolaemus montrouzieri TaxID=559131 RepID=A0ABD2NVB8_9CUCU